MKRMSLLMGCFLVLLSCLSCGKKPKDGNQSVEKSFQPSEPDQVFLAMQTLRRAVRENNLAATMSIITKNTLLDLDLPGEDGDTLLLTSIKKDYREIRDYLLEKGVSVERADASRNTPLMAAVTSHSLNSVQILIDRKVDLNKKDLNGETALHKAIKLEGATTLSQAVRKEYSNIALLLVRSGARVTITDEDNKNAYDLALEFQDDNLLRILKPMMDVEYGTPDATDFLNVLKSGDNASLNLMLTKFPRIVVNYENLNPLSVVLDNTNDIVALGSLRLLLAYVTAVNGPVGTDESPLIKAARMGRLAFVNVLLQANANAALLDKTQKSALYYAMDAINSDMVDVLMAHGAQPTSLAIRNGKILKACTFEKEIEKRTLDTDQKQKLSLIKKKLGCSSWWPF